MPERTRFSSIKSATAQTTVNAMRFHFDAARAADDDDEEEDDEEEDEEEEDDDEEGVEDKEEEVGATVAEVPFTERKGGANVTQQRSFRLSNHIRNQNIKKRRM